MSASPVGSTTVVEEEERVEDEDPSLWRARVLANDALVADVLQRVHPLLRPLSFCQTLRPSSVVCKGKGVDRKVIVQLIMQHLDHYGLVGTLGALQSESGVRYAPPGSMDRSQLLRILWSTTRSIDKLYSDTMTEGMEDEVEASLVDLSLVKVDEREGQRVDVDIWSEEESSDTIVTSPNPSGAKDNVHRGTVNQLVVRLTSPIHAHVEYLKTFLMTYQSFISPNDLLTKLISRFRVPRERAQQMGKSVLKIQMRVVNVLKQWLNTYPEDFSDRMVVQLQQFCQTISSTMAHILSVPLEKRLAMTDVREAVYMKNVFVEDPPEPQVNLSTIFDPKLTIFHLSAKEVSRQLCLVSFDIFARIKPSELLDGAWNKPKLKHRAKNALRMIEHFNRVSTWVTTTIVNGQRVRDRAKAYGMFIRIGKHLKKLKNFQMLMAIVAGLNTSAVNRLKWTQSEVKPSLRQDQAELERFMNAQQSFKVYREELASLQPPCVPYIGLLLTDLTFIDENPATVDGLVNWTKRRLIYNAISKIQQYQQIGYNLQPVHQIQGFLNDQVTLSENELYRLSLLREPRGCVRADVV